MGQWLGYSAEQDISSRLRRVNMSKLAADLLTNWASLITYHVTRLDATRYHLHLSSCCMLPCEYTVQLL